MAWDFHWLPILCIHVVTGRENRLTLQELIIPIPDSLQRLQRARDRFHQDWLHRHPTRTQILALRRIVELSDLELEALQAAMRDLVRFCHGGALELVYRARTRVRMAEQTARQYTHEWVKLHSR